MKTVYCYFIMQMSALILSRCIWHSLENKWEVTKWRHTDDFFEKFGCEGERALAEGKHKVNFMLLLFFN